MIFPDETNTGLRYALTPWTGGLKLTTPGQVIEGYEFQLDTPLQVAAAAVGVVFRNCRFVYTGPLGGLSVLNVLAPNVVVEDCEIDGRSNAERAVVNTGGYGVADSLTIRRCNIHHAGDAALLNSPFTIEDSYLHHIEATAGTAWHSDGIQNNQRARYPKNNDDIVIRGNTILLPDAYSVNCPVFIWGSATDPARNVLIEHNLIAGGSYAISVRYGENFRVIHNYFSTRYHPSVGIYGVWYPGLEGVQAAGNINFETGELIDP